MGRTVGNRNVVDQHRVAFSRSECFGDPVSPFALSGRAHAHREGFVR